MKEERATKSVTLVAENMDDVNTLQDTPFTTLREIHRVPQKKALVLDYNGFLNTPRSVQYYLPQGGYTVVNR